MDKLFRSFGVFLAIIFLVALNIGLSYILPFPYSKLNILFAVIIILMLWFDSGLIVWITFFSHLFIEVFSISPFGLILFSSTISILIAFWLYKHVFTNRSLVATVALASFTLLLYRSLYIVILIFIRLFNADLFISWPLLLVTFMWEFLFTIIIVTVLYLILSKFSHRLDSTVIHSRFFKV